MSRGQGWSREASPSLVYGAALLMRFGVTPHPGFKSRSLRKAEPLEDRLQLNTRARSSTDRASDYGSEGCRFESCRAHSRSEPLSGNREGLFSYPVQPFMQPMTDPEHDVGPTSADVGWQDLNHRQGRRGTVTPGHGSSSGRPAIRSPDSGGLLGGTPGHAYGPR